LSIGDPTLVSDATSAVSMAELFMFYLQGGLVDAALLGGAQIDRYGNLNTTVIGDYANPKVRLPGSGGACEIAINAKKVLIIMRLKRRAFVEQLHFLTSPGHLDGQNARARLGLPGSGPELVITDRALFKFDSRSREMTLFQIAPGESVNSIEQEVGWPLPISEDLREMELPTDEELALIREELDPQGMYR
jgi:glutaconate CoA-transferase subunit B